MKKKLHRHEKKGFVMITVVVVFMFISLGASLVLSGVVYSEASVVRNKLYSSQSVQTSEALQEDIFLRLKRGESVSSPQTLSLNGASAEATIQNESGRKRITSVGDKDRRIRKTEMIVSEGSGASFFYGIQVGQGGFQIDGSARVVGDIYANGPVRGSWASKVTGNVISAGPSGIIDFFKGHHAIEGSAHAQRIQESSIGGDAFYQSIFNTEVSGTSYPGSPIPPPLPLPITDELIDEWKAEAEAGGVYTGSCPYNIGGVAAVEIGHIKIPCNLTIGGSSRVTFTGPVWVEGNISLGGAARITIDEDLEGISLPVIADNPSNRSNGSRVFVNGSAGVVGAGDGSYLILISQNTSSESGGSTYAIDAGGGIPPSDILLYAPHGSVVLGGSAKVTGITAHKVFLTGAAIAEYETGVANMNFSSGGGGGYVFQSLKEVR